jgi:hypothetical protein
VTVRIDYRVALRNPASHPRQYEFIRSNAKRKAVRAGRRSGKTTGAAILAVEAFLRGKRVLYAAPTTEQLEKFWKEVTLALAEPIEYGFYYKNETDHIIERRGTNQRIRGKTAWNADTLRGDYADLLILDEWQLMDEAAWEEVGAPMLMDNNGDAIFIYSPPSLRSRSTTKARDPLHARKMFKSAQEDKTGKWATFHFTSHDNPHISEEGIAEMASDMTRLSYRQEIMAEDLTEVPGALWTQALIDSMRVTEAPDLVRIVVAIDPSGGSTNEAGIIAAGKDAKGHGYVLADASLLAASPKAWVDSAVRLYRNLRADRIVGEDNYGGAMVEATVRMVDANVPYKSVHASRGKLVRAEPIVALYEKGAIHHVGTFPQLEEEQCSYVPGNPSPNRMDALVWAMTELCLEPEHGLIELWKQEAERIKGETSEQPRMATEAEAQMQQATRTNPYAQRFFGDDVGMKKLVLPKVTKPVIVEPTPKCPKCGNPNLSRYGKDVGMQEKCNPCGWSRVAE